MPLSVPPDQTLAFSLRSQYHHLSFGFRHLTFLLRNHSTVFRNPSSKLTSARHPSSRAALPESRTERTNSPGAAGACRPGTDDPVSFCNFLKTERTFVSFPVPMLKIPTTFFCIASMLAFTTSSTQI